MHPGRGVVDAGRQEEGGLHQDPGAQVVLHRREGAWPAMQQSSDPLPHGTCVMFKLYDLLILFVIALNLHNTYMYVHMYMLLCLVVCLILLASFFLLSSFLLSSLIKICIIT